MKNQRLFPASLNLAGKSCLVIGGGKIAEKRVKSLLSCGASVRIVSPQVSRLLRRLAKREAVEWTRDTFKESYLAGMQVVFGATDDRSANQAVYRSAKQRHCLVNLADDPLHCDFHVPSVVRRGNLALAISTDGKAPAFSAWLAKALDRFLNRRLGMTVARYSRLRSGMKAQYPSMRARVKAWQEVIEKDPPPIFEDLTAKAAKNAKSF